MPRSEARLPKLPKGRIRRSSRSKQTAAERATERFAKLILHMIGSRFPDQAFTRDDILMHVSRLRADDTEELGTESAGVNDTSTGTRYRKVCDAIQYLLGRRSLVSLDWLTLCLPEAKDALVSGEPRHLPYVDTVRRLVRQLPPGALFDGMAVVGRWDSDQHLPENVKKMTVRAVFPILVREGTIQRGEFTHQFINGQDAAPRRSTKQKGL